MAIMTDTYSAAEAARLLGISERRARQLAAAGHLTVEQAKPLRLSARSVIEERKRRERKPKAETSGPAGLEPAQLREIVSAIVGDLVPLALEGQRRIEDSLREELAAARAEVAQLQAEQEEESAEVRAALQQLEALHQEELGAYRAEVAQLQAEQESSGKKRKHGKGSKKRRKLWGD